MIVCRRMSLSPRFNTEDRRINKCLIYPSPEGPELEGNCCKPIRSVASTLYQFGEKSILYPIGEKSSLYPTGEEPGLYPIGEESSFVPNWRGSSLYPIGYKVLSKSSCDLHPH
ncbi:MAG: hypothetical protein JWM11_1347 [Planctomycetaceae bacterium]|nr:hypothetical protein [Planctomycetaceae bacterium]